jgi:hypothetical protein
MDNSIEPPPPSPSSLVRVRVGSREYSARRVPNCGTCQHPARMDIETMLVEGHPYTVIARTFSEVEYTVGRQRKKLPKIAWPSIRTHYRNGHMPTDAKAVRDIAEQRLRELGQHAEAMEERAVDSYMTARLVLSKGFDRLARGEVEPTVKETLAAAKLLEEFDIARQDHESGDLAAWQEAMMVYFTEAQQLMSPDLWTEFTRRLTVNPQLQALAARLEGGSGSEESKEYMDGEIVESDKDK